MNGREIQVLVKRLRHEINGLSVKKLSKLDYGDRMLVRLKIESLLEQVNYLNDLGEARCSVVLEALSYYENKD
jgi:hypothetical protein